MTQTGTKATESEFQSSPIKTPSKWNYLWPWLCPPPVFGAILGSIIGWLVVKDRDPEMGKKMWLHGALSFLAHIVLSYIVLVLILGALFTAAASHPLYSGAGSSATLPGEETTLPSQGIGNSGTTATTVPAATCSATPPDSMTDAHQVIASIVCARGDQFVSLVIADGSRAINGGLYEYTFDSRGQRRVTTGTITDVAGAWHLNEDTSVIAG